MRASQQTDRICRCIGDWPPLPEARRVRATHPDPEVLIRELARRIAVSGEAGHHCAALGHATSLRRERVDVLIESARAQGALALLIAPPGYGKTVALRDAVGADPSVVWIDFPVPTRLEDLVRLLTEVAVPSHIAAVPALFDGSGAPKDFERVVEWMARRLRLFAGTIVLDNVQRASGDPQAVTFLVRIIEGTAAYVRWIAASRAVPNFPLGTWVARGLMALPITDADLAFTPDEAAALASARGVGIERDVLGSIVEDSGGWPIAVNLALQLWNRTRALGPLRIRTRDVLFSLIEDELWPHIEADLREVIFACALLAQTDAGVLAGAGFVNAETLLERAHKAIPFLARTLAGGYALHDLFAEFVHKTIRQHPEKLCALRNRLATGLLRAGRHADALHVLIAGSDRTRVLGVLADAGFPLLERGHRAVVAQALTFLAESGSGTDPAVAALRGVLSYADGSTSNAEALYLYASEHGLPPTMRVETGRRLATAYLNRDAGELAVGILEPLIADAQIPLADRIELRSSLAAAFATASRPDDARAIIACVLTDLGSVSPAARARILQRLGFTAFYLGDLERAAEFARDAAQLATDLNMWYYAAAAHSVLYSVTSLSESDSSIALEHARLTFAAGERAGDYGLAAFGLRGEYVLHAYRGDERAFDIVEAQLGRFRDVRTFRSSFPARNARALADAIRGRLNKAISTLCAPEARELGAAERALRDSMLALLLFLADRRDESAALLNAPFLVEAGGDFVSRRYVNLARATRAMALWGQDRTAQARRLLRFDEAAVAENDRILFDVVTAVCSRPRHLVPGAAIHDSLEHLAAHGWGGYGRLFEMIFARLEPATVLTPAEITTLRAFQTGTSTAGVAALLGKSPHTIEAQLKSAYRKIGCTSRAEALVYAQSHGLLDAPGRTRAPRAPGSPRDYLKAVT